MPTPTLNRNIGGLTDEILAMARLDFVIKMPNNLFSEQKRTVNTSIFGFTKTPHDPKDKVIFYNMDDDGLVSVQHKGRIDKNHKWEAIRKNVIDCIKYHETVDAEYYSRPIFKDGSINCYGFKDTENNINSIKIGDLFDFEKGSLQSENNMEGEYDFITASEEWKTHISYDHDCEALVYAIAAGGSLGRSHYVNGKFIASNLCIVLKPKDVEDYPINPRFYNLYFNAIRKQIVNELADGTSKLTISPDDLMDYYIEYFPIDVQDKIVDYYISHVASLEVKLRKEKETLDAKINSLL